MGTSFKITVHFKMLSFNLFFRIELLSHCSRMYFGVASFGLINILSMTFNVSIVMCKWIKLVVISSEMHSKKENVYTSGRLMAPTPKFSLCNILFLFLTLSHGGYSVLTGGCFQGLIQVRFHRTDILYNHCIEVCKVCSVKLLLKDIVVSVLRPKSHNTENWKLKTLILKPSTILVSKHSGQFKAIKMSSTQWTY